MRHALRIPILLCAAAASLILATAAFAADNPPDAVPPLAFMSGGWHTTPLFLAPPSGPGPVVDMPGRPRVANNLRLGQPVFPMADLNNPILQPWAREALKQVNDHVAAGGGAFAPQVSCKLLGVPAFLLHTGRPIYFIQTAKEVLMIAPINAEFRHVYLTDRHSPNPRPSWYGESIGHYENGDTLVVDTVALNDKTYIDNFRTPHTTQLHVVERFRINPDGKGMTITVTVEDPGAFTTPWNAVVRAQREVEAPLNPMREESCAENPVNYLNVDREPVPQADKSDF